MHSWIIPGLEPFFQTLPITRAFSEEVGNMIPEVDPSWVITTNYDFVIECMVLDRGMQLGPNDTFSAQKGQIPILHFHGHRLDPDSIVITQEDYAGLFRPNQYRQSKLPLQIKESTVVSLGYNLGDPNVLMALDWSKNVFHSQHLHIPSEFVQVVRKANPKSDPYRDRNGILVLEVAEIKNFLEELIPNVVKAKAQVHERQNVYSKSESSSCYRPSECGPHNIKSNKLNHQTDFRFSCDHNKSS